MDVQSIVADPQWLVAKTSDGGRALQFVRISREERSTISFLTDEYINDRPRPSVSFPLRAFEQIALPAESSPAFLFHSAFCRSTLLTRALDLPGVAHGVSEPQIVNELALLHRHRELPPQLLDAAIALLARPMGSGEAVVVKPSNEANLLIVPLLNVRPSAKAVLLYAPLPRFLRSVAGKALWGRTWVRRLYSHLRQDHPLALGFSDAEQFQQTDLQIAALAWLTHFAQFQAARAQFGSRIRFLDSETLNDNRAEALLACAEHLGLGGDRELWAERAQSSIFSVHSKLIGTAFDGVEAGSRAESTAVNEEIEMVCTWAQAVAGHIGVSIRPDVAAMLLRSD